MFRLQMEWVFDMFSCSDEGVCDMFRVQMRVFVLCFVFRKDGV